jgi:peptide/nickel transport system substrate-binding protein
MDFNVYNSPNSTGNPVLLDPAFRQALNYAVDRQQFVDVCWHGYSAPAYTILPPGEWVNPDFHWQPPADQAATFDLAKAGQMLDAAGYKLVNGVRMNKAGKPIVLRLEAPSDTPENISEAKLVDGWFTKLGLQIKLEVVGPDVLSARIYNYKGNNWFPDYDLAIWTWDGYIDPGQTLACYTALTLGGWNEPGWSDPTFNKLCDQQATTLDPTKRRDIIWHMQQVMYDQSPILVFTYYDYLQVYNTTKWTGWTPVLNGHGPVIGTSGENIDTYLNLKPAGTVAKKSNTGTVVLIIVIIVVVIGGLAIWLLTRRKDKVEEA